MSSLKLSNPFRRDADRPTLKQRAVDLKASLSHLGTASRSTFEAPPTKTEVGDDTDLLRLGQQFEAARAREIAACDACNEAQREADRRMPERPACLVYRASDAKLMVHQNLMMPEALAGREVRSSDIEWLRRKMPMHHEVLRPILHGERAHVDHPGQKYDIVPHPEAQARVEEIVEAWDRWCAIKATISMQCVTPELDAAANEAGDVAATLAGRIAALPAWTAEGFRVKLRALESYNPKALLSEFDISDEADPDQLLSHSLWRDVQGGAQPTDEPVDWHNPPPGFMAHPAIEPQNFLIVREGLRLELDRLHQIALAEFHRKTERLRERMTEDEAREREAAIRAELFLLPLTAAVDPRSDGAAALRAAGCSVEPDPVLAAIAASRRVETDMDAFARGVEGRPMTDAEALREDWLTAAQTATREDVWTTAPTTPAGLRALVEYARFQAGLTYGADWEAHARRDPFGEIFLALAKVIEARPVIDFGPDEAIAKLADEFCQAYRCNGLTDRAMMAGTGTEAEWKPHHEATVALSKKLEATKPTTLVGMALKCLAPVAFIAWQLSSHDDPAARDYEDRIAAELDAAISSDSLAPILPSPAAHGTLTPDRAWAVAQASALDLSGLPVMHLHNLFESFAEAADQWLSLAHQPWADDTANSEFRRPNAAGRIIDREQDRAGEIRSRIAEEIRSRTPSSANEHDWRLETLIRYEIMCEGSLRHAPELRAEIAKAWGA